jgi:hypothetical protein
MITRPGKIYEAFSTGKNFVELFQPIPDASTQYFT